MNKYKYLCKEFYDVTFFSRLYRYENKIIKKFLKHYIMLIFQIIIIKMNIIF